MEEEYYEVPTEYEDEEVTGSDIVLIVGIVLLTCLVFALVMTIIKKTFKNFHLKVGDKIAFCDMAIYSMVKNNTFNGMPLPTIAVVDKDRKVRIVRKFGYKDFKMRL